MTALLALDPGIRGCGVAVFDGRQLVEAVYVPSPCRVGNGPAAAASMASWVVGWLGGRYRPSELALEWPRIYASRIREGVSDADPNDLLALAGIDAALAALFAPATVTHYAPSDWKGQLPKPRSGEEYVVAARVRFRLRPAELVAAERGAVQAKSLSHNMWDAVGIGLYHLDRFARTRVIPG